MFINAFLELRACVFDAVVRDFVLEIKGQRDRGGKTAEMRGKMRPSELKINN